MAKEMRNMSIELDSVEVGSSIATNVPRADQKRDADRGHPLSLT
jgi:hypothetical protein